MSIKEIAEYIHVILHLLCMTQLILSRYLLIPAYQAELMYTHISPVYQTEVLIIISIL